MSVHDPQVTLRQIQDAARRLQMICAGKTKEQLLADWLATAALARHNGFTAASWTSS